jgi:hypothetical protein
MPAIILIIALVSLPVIAVACIVTGYFKLRRQPVHDIERQYNINGTRHVNDHAIVLRDLPPISWPRERPVVPEHLAPVAKPLPTPGEEIKGVGGGFVEAYGTNGGDRRSAKGKERAHEGFEEAQIYGGHGQEWNNNHLPQANLQHQHPNFSMPSTSSLAIPAPQRAYTHATYGRFNSTQSLAIAMYGDDTKATDAWDKIKRRESLAKPRSRSQPLNLAPEELEDVDLGDSKEWRQAHRPGTPLARPSSAFAVGTDSEEEEQGEQENIRAQEEQVKQTKKTVITPITQMSNTTVASQAPSNVLPGVSHKASWSTSSSHASRRSSELTRPTIFTGISRQSSVRESPATPSRKSSMMGKVRSLTHRSSEISRRGSGEVEMRGGGILVGYEDSDEE